MTDSMFRMGIDGCVPEKFMENEQNMALALFFLLFKDTHTHTHHLVVSSSSSLGLLCFLFFGLGNGMSHHAFERGVEVTFFLATGGGTGKGEGELDVNKVTVELKDYTLVITQRTYGHV